MDKSVLGFIAATAAVVATAVGAYGKFHYDDGYNWYGHGYDKEGYDQEGYNEFGFNKQGYNRRGYNRQGFNKHGYDIEGYDKSGYDKDGFNRHGRNCEGYDRQGKDSSGYFRNGYNSNGEDRGGKTFSFYENECQEIQKFLDKAYGQMNKKEFAYALHDIRICLEKEIKCVIYHRKGRDYVKSTLDDNITFCKNENILEREFIEKLYDAKNHCNALQHDTEISKEYNQVYFTYKVCEEFLEIVKNTCDLQ
jgi:hypothetical protein